MKKMEKKFQFLELNPSFSFPSHYLQEVLCVFGCVVITPTYPIRHGRQLNHLLMKMLVFLCVRRGRRREKKKMDEREGREVYSQRKSSK